MRPLQSRRLQGKLDDVRLLNRGERATKAAIWSRNEDATRLFEKEASAKNNRLLSPFLLPQHGHVA